MNDTAILLYLDLLKRCLINLIYQDPPIPAPWHDNVSFDLEARLCGRDWPSQAHTMIGMKRLNNVQELVQDILQMGVRGDFIETGVARGGATIFMRGLLKAYGVTDRIVWVADSFEGPPSPTQLTERSYSSPEFKQIQAIERNYSGELRKMYAQLRYGSSYDEVRQNFARYDLLDDQVRFLRGWFSDSLPSAPIAQLALLRLDGDLYDSTYDALKWLYPKLSTGGYVTVDDYHTFTECQQAVDDYLAAIGADPVIQSIDDIAVFWRKHL